MDNAVALVRAGLQLNGDFPITQYPVVRKTGDGSFRTSPRWTSPERPGTCALYMAV